MSKQKLLLFALATSFIFLQSVSKGAPIQWSSADGGNDHWYDLILPLDGGSQLNRSFNYSWAAADLGAQQLSLSGHAGHLATVTSTDENAFLEQTFSSLFSPDGRQGVQAWIGLTDENVEGTFEWVTGESFSYSNWFSGEPNNSGGSENYVLYWKNISGIHFNWNDVANDLGTDAASPFVGYLVEFTVPEPTGIMLAIYGCGVFLILRRSHLRVHAINEGI